MTNKMKISTSSLSLQTLPPKISNSNTICFEERNKNKDLEGNFMTLSSSKKNH